MLFYSVLVALLVLVGMSHRERLIAENVRHRRVFNTLAQGGIIVALLPERG